MLRFKIFFVASFVACFFLALPFNSFSSADLSSFVRLIRTGTGSTVFIGNSVLKARSKCDASHRSIPDIFGDISGDRILDLSKGGMRAEFALKLIEFGAFLRVQPKVIYFALPLDVFALEGMAKPMFAVDYFQEGFGIKEKDLPPISSYQGVRYGNYGEFSRKHFVFERESVVCPETLALNKEFAEFMYVRNFVAPGYEHKPEHTDSLVRRLSSLKDSGLNVKVVLMPTNVDDIQALLSSREVDIVRSRVNSLIESVGVSDVIDASQIMRSDDFTDRWCACGHLNYSGRKKLAEFLFRASGS